MQAGGRGQGAHDRQERGRGDAGGEGQLADAPVEQVRPEGGGEGDGVGHRLPVGPERRFVGPEFDAPALEAGEELLEARSLLLAGIRPVPEQRQHLGEIACDLRR